MGRKKKKGNKAGCVDCMDPLEMPTGAFEKHMTRLVETIDRETNETLSIQEGTYRLYYYIQQMQNELNKERLNITRKERNIFHYRKISHLQMKAIKDSHNLTLFETTELISTQGVAKANIMFYQENDDPRLKKLQTLYIYKLEQIEYRRFNAGELMQCLTMEQAEKSYLVQVYFNMIINESKGQFNRYMESLFRKFDERRAVKMKVIEEFNVHYMDVEVEKNNRVIKDLSMYYKGIVFKGLALLNELKEDIRQKKIQIQQAERKLFDAKSDSKKAEQAMKHLKELKQSYFNFAKDNTLPNMLKDIETLKSKIENLKFEKESNKHFTNILKRRYNERIKDMGKSYNNMNATTGIQNMFTNMKTEHFKTICEKKKLFKKGSGELSEKAVEKALYLKEHKISCLKNDLRYVAAYNGEMKREFIIRLKGHDPNDLKKKKQEVDKKLTVKGEKLL